MEALMFYILGLITLVSAVLVVFMRRPIHNVLFMILTMCGIAGLFILLRAEFVGMVQLVVYAGAVMVLFLFVIMLLNLDQVQMPANGSETRWWIGMGLAVALAIMLIPALVAFGPGLEKGVLVSRETAGMTNTELIGKELFTTYLLPFEIASVLLLAAIIGAVVLAKKKY